jgi:MFS family permease
MALVDRPALGVTWILDGLEATLGSALGGFLKDPHLSLGLSDAQIGLGATIYLIGQVVGALVFGFATDRLGRKKLFYSTLIIYLGGTALTGLSWNFATFAVCRFVARAGIGGEYSAIMRVPHRGGPGSGDPDLPRLGAGKSALVSHPWARRRSRKDH